jgi:hypothetical protein
MIKKRVGSMEQTAAFIPLLMAGKQAAPQAVLVHTVCARGVMICMLLLVGVRQHAHVVMQRTVCQREALRERDAQQQPSQRDALNEAERLRG